MAKQVLVDPLPEAVKKNVVWRDTYWLPDEAASIYSMAQAVISVECHSPLIALHNGTPGASHAPAHRHLQGADVSRFRRR
jgi:hypothetical protein